MSKAARTGYLTDVTDEEWAFVLLYLLLSRIDSVARGHDLRAIFSAVRYIVEGGNQWRMMPHDLPPWPAAYQQMRRWMLAGCFECIVEDVQSLLRQFGGRKRQPTAVCIDSRTLQSTPESGARANYDGAKRRKGSKVHIAVDTLGHLMALTVTPADAGDRTQVEALAQQITGNTAEMAYVDQGYTGPNAAEAARPAPGSGQTSDGQTRLRAPAAPLGGRKKLRLGRTLPQTRQRLRTARHHTQRIPLPLLRLSHARKNVPPAQLTKP